MDLVNEYQVNRVAITNRVGDTYYQRINGAVIRVGNFPADVYSNPMWGLLWLLSLATAENEQKPKTDDLSVCRCAVISTIPSGATANYSCGGMGGRYVIVHIPGNEKVLTLCEVEVYGFLLGKSQSTYHHAILALCETWKNV